MDKKKRLAYLKEIDAHVGFHTGNGIAPQILDLKKVSDNSDFTELDGGVYDNPESSIYEALDERKTRELAEKLCSRDKIGNQDVALVIQEARDKLEEKRLTPNTTPYIL